LCSEPWATILVTSAGEVRTCCLNDLVFGNLHERTIDEIWNGDAYVRFREQHARNAAADGCTNCVRNGRVQGSTWFRATEAVTMRPVIEKLPPVAGDALTIDAISPALRITGRVQRGIRRADVEVMIDETPVETLVHAAVDRDTYTLGVPTHFLTEGAHILWLRHRDGRAFAQREVHFRRT
jgi:radical SAM protein with 4Fe4S-binding SPASM domain